MLDLLCDIGPFPPPSSPRVFARNILIRESGAEKVQFSQ